MTRLLLLVAVVGCSPAREPWDRTFTVGDRDALTDPDPWVRERAARNLLRPSPADVDSLRAMLDDPEPNVVRAASGALVRVEPLTAAVVADLVRRYCSPHSNALMRSAIDRDIASLRGDTMMHLAEALPLATTDEGRRWLLGRLERAVIDANTSPGRRTGVRLAAFVADPDDETARTAARILARMGTDAIPALDEVVNRFAFSDPLTVGVLKATGPTGIERAVSRLDSAEGVVVLAQLSPSHPELLPAALRAFAHDELSPSRDQLERALTEVPLLDALRNATDPKVADSLMMAVGHAGGADAVTALVRQAEIRPKSLAPFRALAIIGPKARDSVPLILAHMNNDNRTTLADAIATIGADATPALREALRSGSEADRVAAAFALRVCASKGGRWWFAALPELVACLSNESKNVRISAAEAIGAFGPDAVDAVPELVRLLDDKVTRTSASLALGRIGPAARSALPALEKFDDPAALRARLQIDPAAVLR